MAIIEADPAKTYGLIQDGRVHWKFTAAQLPNWDDAAITVVELPPGVEEQWLWDGQDFSAPPSPPAVQAAVTPRQIRLALIEIGLYDAATAAISSAGQAAMIEWEYATQIERGHPLVAAMAAALGRSEQDIDNLFILAATK